MRRMSASAVGARRQPHAHPGVRKRSFASCATSRHVGPDLALERRPAGRRRCRRRSSGRAEPTCSAPRSAPWRSGRPRRGRRRSRRARAEHATLDDAHLVVHGERDRLDAAHEHVLAPAGGRAPNGCITSSGDASGDPSAPRAIPSGIGWSARRREARSSRRCGALAHDDEVVGTRSRTSVCLSPVISARKIDAATTSAMPPVVKARSGVARAGCGLVGERQAPQKRPRSASMGFCAAP